MENMECPGIHQCPIFSGVLQGTQYTETYKQLYCLGGPEGRAKCMRFKVKKAVGKCPEKVLPNSTRTLEEIIEEMKVSGEI